MYHKSYMMRFFGKQEIQGEHKLQKLDNINRRAQLKTSIRNQPTNESFTSVLPLSLRPDPPPCNQEKTISINRDLVYIEARRLSHDIYIISNYFLYYMIIVFN